MIKQKQIRDYDNGAVWIQAADPQGRPPRSLKRWPGWAGLSLLLIAAAPGCALESGRGELLVPERESFPLVADALELRCATLDCHGAAGRNLRLYTGTGMRLDPAAMPGSGSTTEAEYDASYRSLIALEPEVLSAVIADGGARPERLTLVRKARGAEKHAGQAVVVEGDPADRCLTSWLSSQINEDACMQAAELPRPDDGEGGASP
jgi:hypothetical protein